MLYALRHRIIDEQLLLDSVTKVQIVLKNMFRPFIYPVHYCSCSVKKFVISEKSFLCCQVPLLLIFGKLWTVFLHHLKFKCSFITFYHLPFSSKGQIFSTSINKATLIILLMLKFKLSKNDPNLNSYSTFIWILIVVLSLSTTHTWSVDSGKINKLFYKD